MKHIVVVRLLQYTTHSVTLKKTSLTRSATAAEIRMYKSMRSLASYRQRIYYTWHDVENRLSKWRECEGNAWEALPLEKVELDCIYGSRK